MSKEGSKERGFNNRTAKLFTACGILPLENIYPFAKGFHHRAYVYEIDGTKPKVVKVASPIKIAGVVHTAAEEQNNATVIQQAFGTFSVPTEVRDSAEGYCIVMDKIDGKPLHADQITTVGDRYNPDLRSQLIHLVDRNKQLLRETGVFLDLTGAHALFDEFKRPFGYKRTKDLANILVEQEQEAGLQRLKIIDTDLIPLRQGNPVERMKSLVIFMANYQVLARDFGIDLRLNKPTVRERRPR